MESPLIIKILYAAASIQGIFLAVMMIFRSKVNQPANRILGILLLLLSFHLVLVGFDERGFFMRFPHLSRISWIIGSLYWPLLFLFVQYITRTQPAKIWKSFWAFIPFVILLIAMLPYYSMSAVAKREILDNFEAASAADFGVINNIVSILHVLFQLFFLIYYLRVEKSLLNEYSEIESVRIKWLKQFLLWSFVITVIAVISFFAKSWNVPVLSKLYRFHFIGIVFLLYWLSYHALTQPVLFGIGERRVSGDAPKPTEPPVKPADLQQPIYKESVGNESAPKYRKSTLDDAQREEIFEQVKTALVGKRLFQKPDLTLSELSSISGIPRHHLSESINSCYHGNFFDLINDYRVEAFKKLATDEGTKHLSLLGIAQEAGFNSKATFYAVFRKKTGMTPTEFLETTAKVM